jgi:type IV secretory pathway VirB10-like protein
VIGRGPILDLDLTMASGALDPARRTLSTMTSLTWKAPVAGLLAGSVVALGGYTALSATATSANAPVSDVSTVSTPSISLLPCIPPAVQEGDDCVTHVRSTASATATSLPSDPSSDEPAEPAEPAPAPRPTTAVAATHTPEHSVASPTSTRHRNDDEADEREHSSHPESTSDRSHESEHGSTDDSGHDD